MANWEDRVVAVAERVLVNGTASMGEMQEALVSAGLRRVDEGKVWEILVSRGVAELVEGRYQRRGAAEAPPDAPTGHGETPQRFVSGATTSSRRTATEAQADPSRLASLELRQIRSSLDISPLPGEQVTPRSPLAWRARAAELARAVDEELRASASRVVLQDVPVTDGHRVAETKTRVLWQFDVQGELPSGEGTTVTFIPDTRAHEKDTYEAEIISVFGSDVTLALPPECVNASSGRLRCDVTWLLVKQKQRLHAVADGAPGFSGASALSLTQPESRGPESVEPDELLVPGLNEEQSRAVATAREPHLAWLWGPPGTGKTTTVAAIVEALAEDGKRVLLVAPTNVAVDVALSAVLRRLGPREPGYVVRLGPPVDTGLIERAEGHVLVDEVAADRGSHAAQRRVESAKEIVRLRADLNSLKRRGTITDGSRLQLDAQLADEQGFARGLDEVMVDLRRQVCRDARVVAATTHQVLLRSLEGLPFDVVVIDEGSMVPTSLAALVAGSCKGHVIVAGDFRQLPPVAISDTPNVHRWLRRSPFESCGVDTSVRTDAAVPGLVALVEQHRMREKISDAVSSAFYPESPLRTADGVRARGAAPTPPSWPDDALILIDTSNLGPRVSRRHGQWSRLNVAHAQIATALAQRLGDNGSDLAFISPFAPQAKILGSLAGESIRASTVHRYQGSEAGIVVFDAVDSTQSVGRLHPWFADGGLGSDGARLVNVAASRAKDQLVLLADMSRIHRGRQDVDAIARFLRQMERQATSYQWQAAVSGTVTNIVTDPVASVATALNHAESAEMFLPRTTPTALNRLLTLVEAGRLHHVTVWLSPEDADGPAARLLERAGAFPRALEPLRESLVVTEDTVITASGPLLGIAPRSVLVTKHRDLAESVRRVVRRRDGGHVPGSGRHGEQCGRCRRHLVRIESPRFGARYECLTCDAPRVRR